MTIRMLAAAAIVLSGAFAVASCDDGKPKQMSAATRAVIERQEKEKAAAEAEEAARKQAREAEMAALAGGFADTPAFVAGCTADGRDAAICGCLGEAAFTSLGAPGLQSWVWELYITGGAMPTNRATRWMETNKIDAATRSKFETAAYACVAPK